MDNSNGTSRRAVIYARVSSDRTGVARSVAQQEAACRRICASEGWQVADVLIDNDAGASRWSRSKRPAYDRLREILRPGDVLVTWEASRAQRDLQAYVSLRELCSERDVLWSYSGRTYDLNRADDRFITLLDAGLSEMEVEKIRDRTMRSLRANLEAGKPHGRLPFGYRNVHDEATGAVLGRDIDPVEGPIVKEIYDRILDGDPLRRIATDLNERGQLQRSGVPWTGTNLRQVVLKPTYAGLRTHKGEVVGKGTWPAIVSEDDYHRIVALLKDPARRTHTRGTAPRGLISHIAVCGACGGHVRRQTRRGKVQYACGECAGFSVASDLIDAEVEQWIFKLLSDQRVHDRMREGPDNSAQEARQKIEAIRARMDEFALSAAKGDISARAFSVMEQEWLAEIEALEPIAHRALPHPKLAELTGPYAREKWEHLDLEIQRDIIRTTLEIKIFPRTAPYREQPKPPTQIRWRGLGSGA